jgi:hypothetical protein
MMAMGDDILEIVAAVDDLSDVTNEEDLQRLVALIDAFFAAPEAADHLQVWFRLFERFPTDDGYEGFWSILHGLEAYAGTESLVVESVRRRPARFPLLMVNRMINGGMVEVEGVKLLDLLRAAAADERALASVRAEAERYLSYQLTKRTGE